MFLVTVDLLPLPGRSITHYTRICADLNTRERLTGLNQLLSREGW